MSLTDTAIRNAKPGKKSSKLYDERGLYLEVSPSGGKWWRLKYRFDGKEKRLSLLEQSGGQCFRYVRRFHRHDFLIDCGPRNIVGHRFDTRQLS